MAADVHHLDDGVFVGEIHVGDSATAGGVSGHAIISWHNNLALVVALDNEFTVVFQLLLLHGEFGGHHLAE